MSVEGQPAATLATATQAPAVDGAAPAPVETKAPDDQLSPKFAHLARQQKAIRKAQMDLKAREDALKAKELEYQTGYIQKSKLKADPYAALTEEGISYDEVVKAALAQDPNALALKKIEQRLESFDEKIKRQAEEATQRQAAEYEQAVVQIGREVKLLVDADPNFETIKANDAQDAVVDLIKETFEKDGTLLTVEDAALQVEEYLLEQAVKMASLEKVKKKLQPPTAPAPNEATTPKPVTGLRPQITARPQAGIPQGKTITHAATVAPAKPLTAKDRRERAIAAFRGELG